MICIHFICQFHHSYDINTRDCFHTVAHAMHAGRFKWWTASNRWQWTMTDGTIAVLTWNARFPTQPKKIWNLENVCYKINQGGRLVWRVQSGFDLSHQPGFLTNPPWSWVPCPGILHNVLKLLLTYRMLDPGCHYHIVSVDKWKVSI